MESLLTTKFHPVKPALMAATVMASLTGLITEVSAAGFSVQQIKAPGPAVRMSSAGYLTGTYQVRCGKLGGQPPRRICWYAPWIYDGKSVTKVQWPVDWNYVYSLGINDSLELVGREYRGSLTAGGWLYSGGVVTYSGSLPGGGGSLLAAINNNGVAVGTAQTSTRVGRAVTFQNTGGVYALAEVPAFASTVPTTGSDLNDEGDIAGTYTESDGSQHAFAYINGETIAIPDLPGATDCRALRIAQIANSGQEVWVAGNCGDRGFIYRAQGTAGELVELNNLEGQSGGVTVQSVNGLGDAVGAVAGKAVMWRPSDITATAIDLNQFTPKNVTLSRGIDINDDGTILASYTDSSGNVSTYLLTPTP